MEGIDYLIDLNRRHSAKFSSAAVALARQQYRVKHPTEIAALKCMDGRLHLPLMTQTALGIIQPFRNLGGEFNLGWPYFQSALADWVSYAVMRGRDALPLVTYHWSKGDRHRGCRGFSYDREAAVVATKKLQEQIDRRFGRGVVYAIQVGIETDEESLLFHGTNGETLDTATAGTTSADVLLIQLHRMYPGMREQMVADLLPLVLGNIAHVAEVRATSRPIQDAEHREWVLGVGRGFDWLHEINTALIVGPWEPDLARPIEIAAKLLQGNIDEGRVIGKKIVLLSVAPYREESGPEPGLAEEKAMFVGNFALKVIQERVSALAPKLQLLIGTIDMNTRLLSVVERRDSVA